MILIRNASSLTTLSSIYLKLIGSGTNLKVPINQCFNEIWTPEYLITHDHILKNIDVS